MGLAGQHGPLAAASVGRFLTPSPLPGPLLFAEPLRRRMRVRLGELWIADSEDVVLLHEPGRYPVAYFPQHDVCAGVLIADGPVTRHPDLGTVTWLRVETAQHEVENAAWRYDSLPSHAAVLAGRVAFSWQAMTAFYEEDERIVGTPPTSIDQRRSGRRCSPPMAKPSVPYKGIASYYSVGSGHAPPGPTSMPGRRRTGCATWCPSIRTRSTCSSTVNCFTPSRRRPRWTAVSSEGCDPTRSSMPQGFQIEKYPANHP